MTNPVILKAVMVCTRPPEITETLTNPVWIKATDEKVYVVKTPIPNIPNSNFNEYLASKLCTEVGISVLEPHLMYLSQEFIDMQECLNQRNLKEGHYFATLYHPEAHPMSGNVDMITNLDEVSDFIILDIFIHNVDRNPGNTLEIPKSASPNSGLKYVLIDHGLCFQLTDGTVPELPYCIHKIPWALDKVDPDRLRRQANQMCTKITTQTIVSIYGDMRDWVDMHQCATMLRNVLVERSSDKIIDCISKYSPKLMKEQ